MMKSNDTVIEMAGEMGDSLPKVGEQITVESYIEAVILQMNVNEDSDVGIQIRAFFGDWKTVNKDVAKQFVISFMSRITTSSNVEKRMELTNRHIKGITVQALLKCEL